METKILIFSLLFLLGASCITAFTKALQTLGRIQIKKEFNKKPHFYFFASLIKRLFPKDNWDSLFYLLSFTKHILRLVYATTFFLFFLSLFAQEPVQSTAPEMLTLPGVILAIVIVTAVGLALDFFIRFLVGITPKGALKVCSPLTTFFLLLFSPLTFTFLKTQSLLFHQKKTRPKAATRLHIKEKILELVHESELSALLDPLDRRLISSIASFRDRIAREIMVPRIDIFSLSIDQTVHEAAQKFLSEGYSRIPIYKENVDNIVGVLLYKDVMEYYFHSIENKETSPLETPLEKLLKPILYAPETKKISQLLQEFRQQQIHLAIVVDEYGGTEGIVTIEDILEELVGEIADEYDIIEEEKLYTAIPTGGWIIDAKMNILDIEKELGVLIPRSPEYDTIGGFVFHRAGTIPSKGWKIHNDNFDLEVLSSSERSVEKVIITLPPS